MNRTDDHSAIIELDDALGSRVRAAPTYDLEWRCEDRKILDLLLIVGDPTEETTRLSRERHVEMTATRAVERLRGFNAELVAIPPEETRARPVFSDRGYLLHDGDLEVFRRP